MSNRVICSEIRLGCKRHEPKGTAGGQGGTIIIHTVKQTEEIVK